MKDDPLGIFEQTIKDMPRAELGGLIKEYIAESNHQGWDGYARRDLTGIRKFVTDLMIYHKNTKDDFPDHDFATRINNVNPVA